MCPVLIELKKDLHTTRDTCAKGSEVLTSFRTDIVEQFDDNTANCQQRSTFTRLYTHRRQYSKQTTQTITALGTYGRCQVFWCRWGIMGANQGHGGKRWTILPQRPLFFNTDFPWLFRDQKLCKSVTCRLWIGDSCGLSWHSETVSDRKLAACWSRCQCPWLTVIQHIVNQSFQLWFIWPEDTL